MKNEKTTKKSLFINDWSFSDFSSYNNIHILITFVAKGIDCIYIGGRRSPTLAYEEWENLQNISKHNMIDLSVIFLHTTIFTYLAFCSKGYVSDGKEGGAFEAPPWHMKNEKTSKKSPFIKWLIFQWFFFIQQYSHT